MPNTPNFEAEANSGDCTIDWSALIQFFESKREKMIELFGEEKTEWLMNCIAKSGHDEEGEQRLLCDTVDLLNPLAEKEKFLANQKNWLLAEKGRITSILSKIEGLDPRDANAPEIVELKEYLENDIKETDILISQGF